MSLDLYFYDGDESVFEENITHNLSKMASYAGVRDVLWEPESCGVTKAGDMILRLQVGLSKLESDPDAYQQFTPENGWGSSDGLVLFVRKALDAAREYPNARVYASR